MAFFEDPELCVEDPVSCNLFSYARNNPLKYVDPSGKLPILAPLAAVGSALLTDFVLNPSTANAPGRDGRVDLSLPPEAKLGLAIGVAALSKGVWNYTASRGRATQVVREGGSNSGAKPILNDVIGRNRIGSANKSDPHHSFPDLVDNHVASGIKFEIPTKGPGGKTVRTSELYQVEGGLNGRNGVFEWIVDRGDVTHRRFIPNGKITGTPNQVPKKGI